MHRWNGNKGKQQPANNMINHWIEIEWNYTHMLHKIWKWIMNGSVESVRRVCSKRTRAHWMNKTAISRNDANKRDHRQNKIIPMLIYLKFIYFSFECVPFPLFRSMSVHLPVWFKSDLPSLPVFYTAHTTDFLHFLLSHLLIGTIELMQVIKNKRMLLILWSTYSSLDTFIKSHQFVRMQTQPDQS